jgi:biopolymer transport protein ExbD
MAARSLFGAESPFRRRRHTSSADIDLTSAIDVVFQLIIFFMVTSTMSQRSAVEVPAAAHGTGVDLTTATVITLLAPREAGADAPVFLGDGAADPQAVAGTRQRAALDRSAGAGVDEVNGYIERAVTAGKGQIIIKAEKRVPHRDVLRVARQVAAVEGATLFVAVEDLENQPPTTEAAKQP